MTAVLVLLAGLLVAGLFLGWLLTLTTDDAEARAQAMLCEHKAPKHRCVKCWLEGPWSDPDMDLSRLTEEPGPGERTTAYYMGVEAFESGRSRAENPYHPRFQISHGSWDEGWFDAWEQKETGK